MVKDELKTLEKYMKELEALRRYPRVKQERDSLAAEVAQLKKKAAALESEVSTKNEASSQLSKREAEISELASKLAEAGKEITSLRNFEVKLPSGELTLDEMRAQFLHAEEDEVEKKVKERLQVLKENIRRQMPNLVHKRLIQVLESPNWPPEITKVIDSRAGQIADGILRDRDQWPDWFKSYYCRPSAIMGHK